ncbi:zeta toxin family protein [Candidatus Saccharibacteria bacterium]|nr:zeta toxin family protein [Candidatus Saccharibacteria bacterium]
MNNIEDVLGWVKDNKKSFVLNMVREAGVEPDAEPGAFFMAGLPGAGKTEISKNLIADFNIPILRIDMDEIAERLPGYRPEKADEFRKPATLLLSELFSYTIHHDLDFLMDGTFGSMKASENIERCLKRGYSVKIVYAFQDPKLAWEFTLAREKVEHRAIKFDGFVEAYYKTISNIKIIGKKYSNKIVIDVAVKDKENQVGEWKRNVRVDEIDKLLNVEYNKDKLIEEILGK